MMKFAIVSALGICSVNASMDEVHRASPVGRPLIRVSTEEELSRASPVNRPMSPVVNPKRFIIRALCQRPDSPSDLIFTQLVRSGFPASQRSVFDDAYMELTMKTRMPRYLHDILFSISAGIDAEYNELMLERSIASLARRGLDRAAIERNLEFWSKACVAPLLVKKSSRGEVPCYLDAEADQWILSDANAHDLFCSEYQYALFN